MVPRSGGIFLEILNEQLLYDLTDYCDVLWHSSVRL
jgi:hypothetical protein